ncbi:hypothetical protein ACIP5Y_21675 [Nocardia sp. NPDC088792]|uniref:hypothetical protein n=1 Tax=Nocardia sp. NPDC088792 TaxID=3364332 RepID=UPI0037F9E216
MRKSVAGALIRLAHRIYRPNVTEVSLCDLFEGIELDDFQGARERFLKESGYRPVAPYTYREQFGHPQNAR